MTNICYNFVKIHTYSYIFFIVNNFVTHQLHVIIISIFFFISMLNEYLDHNVGRLIRTK